MHHAIRRWIGLAVCAVIVGAAPAFAANVGTADQVQGVATAVRQGASVSLAPGTPIAEDDEITTGPGAKLIVVFIDGTRLTLGPNAEIVVDEFVYNPAGDGNRAVLKVAAGTMRLFAGAIEKVSGPKAVKIDTPVATIGIRGTDFFVELTGAHLSVALFSGSAVDVTNAAGTTVLRPGEGTDVFGTLAPTAARPWAPDRINRALTLTSVLPGARRAVPYARPPAPATTFSEAVTQGKFTADLRLRMESVDQASRPRAGMATTARLRAGYETLAYQGFYAGVSGEITRALDHPVRNDGVNGRIDLPLIPDPPAQVLHEAYAGWSDRDADGLARSRIVVGRQRIQYENERWIGPSEFRQNAQSFDAVTAETRAIPGVALRYAYLTRINRILGDNPGGHWSSNSHLFGAVTNALPYGITTAYAYLLDLRPVPQFSSATVGVRYEGRIPLAGTAATALLETEFARQSDYGRNPRDFDLGYWLIQPGVSFGRTTLSVGWEHLGSNGSVAVQTPLATLHRQNGWADVFTVTPPQGLRDARIRWLQELPDLGPFKMPKLDVRYLDFASTSGPKRHYGDEWDADISATVGRMFTLGMRFARYDADRFDTDTTKVWAYLELHY